jgi:hypothetical protein
MTHDGDVAYLVGGPADGDVIALPLSRVVQIAELPEVNWIVDPTDDIICVDLRIVEYEPATPGGFLWYARPPE